MELSQLEYFVVLAEQLHYRRAAATLGVSASTLSRQIVDLETDLDAQLLDRNRRQVRLTPAGEAFLVDAKATLHRLRFAAIDARRIGRGEQGRLRVGHGDAAATSLLQLALPEVRRAHPGVRLQVVEAPSARLVEEVASGELDVALVRPPLHRSGLEHQHLCDEPLVVVVPAGHPLAGRRRLRIADLAGEALVVPDRAAAAGSYDAVMAAFAAARVPPDITEEATTSASMLLMVGAGLGVALIPAAAAEHHDIDGVVAISLTGTACVSLHLAWRSGDEQPAVTALRAALVGAVEHGLGVRASLLPATASPGRRRIPAGDAPPHLVEGSG